MGDFPLQPGHFRCQPDDFLAQRGDPIPQQMNECVFLRVRQASKIGQFLHAAYCQLSFPFLNPDQRLFYGEPEQLPFSIPSSFLLTRFYPKSVSRKIGGSANVLSSDPLSVRKDITGDAGMPCPELFEETCLIRTIRVSFAFPPIGQSIHHFPAPIGVVQQRIDVFITAAAIA